MPKLALRSRDTTYDVLLWLKRSIIRLCWFSKILRGKFEFIIELKKTSHGTFTRIFTFALVEYIRVQLASCAMLCSKSHEVFKKSFDSFKWKLRDKSAAINNTGRFVPSRSIVVLFWMCRLFFAMLRYLKKEFLIFSLFRPTRRVRVRKKPKMIGITRNLVQRCSSSNVQLSQPVEKLIILEGNIGVGKTTLACQLARKLDYKLFLEPTTKNPYLAKFYQDPKKYALKLQLWIFRQRFLMFASAAKHLLETGIYLFI